MSMQEEINGSENIVGKNNILDILKELDKHGTIEDSAREALITFGDYFVENLIKSSCEIARARKSTSLSAKDVSFYLEKEWGIYAPESDGIQTIKKLNFSSHNE
ncbi:hypothetical protein HZS_7824, partial [Henneguya salminicola]